MFGNKRFLASLRNTVVYCLATVPLTLIAALGLAVILNQKVRGRNFFRTVSFFPYVASLVAVAAVWNMLFSPAKSGPVNMILYNLGVAAKDLPKWSAGKNWVMFTVILFSVWKNMGYNMVIYLAGLQGINAELYEASSVDGAKGYQTFFKITLPYMLYITTPYLIATFTGNVNNFNVIYLLSSGDPVTDLASTAGKTDLLVTWLYKLTIDKQYYNIGAVIGILTFIILAVGALLTYRNSKSYKDEEAF